MTLADRILAGLRAHPVERGVEHPVEAMLRDAFAHDAAAAGRDVAAMMACRPPLRAPILQCLAHVHAAAAAGTPLAVEALRSPDFETRDAAIEALVAWDTSAGWVALQAHRDPDPYLAGYVADLLAERSR